MYPVAIVFAFSLAILGTLGLAIEQNHLRADTQQQAARYAIAFLPQAEQQFAAAAAQNVAAGQTPAPIPTTSPVALCPHVSKNQQCHYYGALSVARMSGTANSGTAEQSTNVNASADEQRWAGAATVVVTNSSGTVLASRTREFTIRTYYDMTNGPGAVVENSSDNAGSVGADGDPAGCSAGATCGDDTRIQSYVACNDLSALNPVVQAWEQEACTTNNSTSQGNWATTPSASLDYLGTSTYTNPTWNNKNANSTGWSR